MDGGRYDLDAVSGEPVDAKSIKDGSTVYAWLGAQTAVAMSLPPQVTPELLLVNGPGGLQGSSVRCDRPV